MEPWVKDRKDSETEKFITHRSGRRFTAHRGSLQCRPVIGSVGGVFLGILD